MKDIDRISKGSGRLFQAQKHDFNLSQMKTGPTNVHKLDQD